MPNRSQSVPKVFHTTIGFATTRRLAIINLAIRGSDADIGKEYAATFRNA